MVHQDNLVADMLRNIPDPKMREQYGRLISGAIVQVVRCMSDTCNGRIIANISDAGIVTETQPELSEDGAFGLYSSGLEGSRLRFDGRLGFRCYCGNNSILCEEEKGIITPAPPSEDDLHTIALRLSKRTNIILPEVGKQTVDGFIIEDVKV